MTKTVLPPFIARQGDVLIIQTGDIDASTLTPAPKDARGIVLAEGESSGHYHQIVGKGCKLMAFRDAARVERLLRVGRSGAELRILGGEKSGVPRHAPIQVGAGDYLVRVQRTWTAGDQAKSEQVND